MYLGPPWLSWNWQSENQVASKSKIKHPLIIQFNQFCITFCLIFFIILAIKYFNLLRDINANDIFFWFWGNLILLTVNSKKSWRSTRYSLVYFKAPQNYHDGIYFLYSWFDITIQKPNFSLFSHGVKNSFSSFIFYQSKPKLDVILYRKKPSSQDKKFDNLQYNTLFPWFREWPNT